MVTVVALVTAAALAGAVPARARAQDGVAAPTPADITEQPAATPPTSAESARPADARDARAVPTAAEAAEAQSDREYADSLRRRASIARIHRIFGVTTWGAMIGTLTLGFIRFHDLYGSFAGIGDNPCVRGTAVFQDGCARMPLPHLISSMATTALYATTFTLSLLMPDPDESSAGDSAFARRLRTHKVLRWVHFFGMVSQIALGVVMSNLPSGTRANHYETLQALATVHMGLGLVTFGALTWAGALMVF